METIFLTPLISAGFDILLMLLGAFIIGFVIAWLLRSRNLRRMKEEGYHLKEKVGHLMETRDSWEIKMEQLKSELEQCSESKQGLVSKEELDKALSDLRIERERSLTARSSLTEIENAHDALKDELAHKINQMISQDEATRLQAEANRLKVFNASLQEEITMLKAKENQDTPSMEPLPDPPRVNEGFHTTAIENESKGYSFLSQAGIKIAQEEDKDDLKLINGIGPFIEKKLNQIGIFTFEQIASLSHEQSEKITEAIEFFPGRIQRDNWVGQAQDLM